MRIRSIMSFTLAATFILISCGTSKTKKKEEKA